MKLVPPPVEIDYPTSDGRPMAETPVHMDCMIYLLDVLNVRYAADPMIYVWGNLLMFYEEGNRRHHVSPDVFVVKGVPKKRVRENYKIWEEEGKAPNVVFELTSKSTKKEDQETKFRLYRDVLKVPEYILFDPQDEYLDPPLQGYRLVDGEYVAIDLVDGRLPSDELGIQLERQGPDLRLLDAVMGTLLLTKAEIQSERADKAEKRAERVAKRAAREKERAEQEAKRAEQEAKRAEQEAKRAEQEMHRRREAELETERLRQQIEELRRGRST